MLFGEGEGRTVGSCVSRLRIFLASVGSDGFVPAAQVAEAAPPVQPQMASRPQAAAMPPPVSHRGPPVLPAAVSLGRSTAPPQSPAMQSATAESPSWLSASELVISPEVLAHFNVFTNGQALLTAAGGASLVLVGLRLIWKSRQ